MSDELMELPERWEETTLGQIVLGISYGHTASSTETPVGPKFLRITDLQNNSVDWDTVPYCECDSIEKYKLKKGDIVVARTGATTGKSFLIQHCPEPTVFASYLIRLQTSTSCSPDYLAAFMQSDNYWKQITTVSKGTAQPGANASILATLSVPLPPLNEQRRIVAKIEELRERSQKARSHLSAIPNLCDKFRQSVLAAAFRGDLTADWREQNPDVEPASVLLERIRVQDIELPDSLALSELPEGWSWSNLGAVGKVSGGLTKNSKRDELPLEFPYLRVANVYANSLDLSEVKTIKIHEGEYKRVLLQEGDLLLVEGNGSIDQIGRVALWNGSIDPCLHQNHLIKVRFNPTEIGQYILLWLLSHQGRKYITRVASSTAGLHTLSLSKVSALPAPIASQCEQREIVKRIETLFQIVNRFEQEFNKSESQVNLLDRSILAKAFRGELVEQEPNDEPASILLERIRAEREQQAQGKAKKPGKNGQRTIKTDPP